VGLGLSIAEEKERAARIIEYVWCRKRPIEERLRKKGGRGSPKKEITKEKLKKGMSLGIKKRWHKGLIWY